MRSADDWIETLRLARHPEGGFFREIYRAGESIPAEALPSRYGGPRPFSTSIFFLLKSGQVSHFHRLRSDENWHFYEGAAVVFHVFEPSGAYRRFRLGRNPDTGEAFQVVLPRASVFGAEVVRSRSFALCGCTVAPGFEFADFAFVRREELLRRFPELASLIERLAVP